MFTPLLISFLLLACNGPQTFFNKEANKMPGDDAFLKGKVKQIVFTGRDTTKAVYADFDRNGNITETNIYADSRGNIITDGSTVTRNEYYSNNHIKRRIISYGKLDFQYCVDTFVQIGDNTFKMFRKINKYVDLWHDGFDSLVIYTLLKYDDNGYLKREEMHRVGFLKQKKIKDELRSLEDYKNNASGFPVAITSWGSNGQKNKMETKLYLSKWNVPDSIKISGENHIWTQYNQFDKYGNITERKIRASVNAKTGIDKFVYQYDAKGNWITRARIYSFGLRETEKRTITYWD